MVRLVQASAEQEPQALLKQAEANAGFAFKTAAGCRGKPWQSRAEQSWKPCSRCCLQPNRVAVEAIDKPFENPRQPTFPAKQPHTSSALVHP